MAKAKVTVEALTQFSNALRANLDDIIAVKNSMDNELKSFIWDDPVGRNFIIRYGEDLQPIEGKLIPNLEAYCTYLDQEAALITEFGGNLL